MTETPSIDVRISAEYFERSLAADVTAGLRADPKTLPPRWFYDAEGSRLFERITELPEYYPTRAESAILRSHACEFAGLTGAHSLVELGSGSSEKTRLLLDALAGYGTLREFVPLDVSAAALREAAAKLAVDYPLLRVHGVVGDFAAHLADLPGERPRLVAFLGGTIGNQEPQQRAAFLNRLHDELVAGDWLLVGTDLVKDPTVLVAAYDDTSGVTAAFNRNMLHVLNRELGADFDPSAFEHLAVWDPRHEWIEMRLRATHPMRVRVAALGLDVEFGEGESLRTEVSAKFRRRGIERELRAAGFTPRRYRTDTEGRFALTLAERDAGMPRAGADEADLPDGPDTWPR